MIDPSGIDPGGLGSMEVARDQAASTLSKPHTPVPCHSFQVSFFDPDTDRVRFFRPGQGTGSENESDGRKGGTNGKASVHGDRGQEADGESKKPGESSQEPNAPVSGGRSQESGPGDAGGAQSLVETGAGPERTPARSGDNGEPGSMETSRLADAGCGAGAAGDGTGHGDEEEEVEYQSLSCVRILRGPSLLELEKRGQALSKWGSLGDTTPSATALGVAPGGGVTDNGVTSSGGAAASGAGSPTPASSPAPGTPASGKKGSARKGKGKGGFARRRSKEGSSLLAVGALAKAMASAAATGTGGSTAPAVPAAP